MFGGCSPVSYSRMRARLYFLILLAAAARIDTAGAISTPDFSHYRIILDRRPFGEPPVQPMAPAPSPRPQPVVPPFTKNFRLCALTEKYGDVRVGFIDISAKPPKTFFLWLGESEDGIRVVDVDFDRSAALLEKDGEQLWLDMGGVPGKSREPTPRAAGGPDVADETRAAAYLSYSDRLKRRREAVKRRQDIMKQRSEAFSALDRDLSPQERVEKLRQYQMDLIRAKGDLGPVLPIPLTPEMDDQLVAEGVLPPITGE